MTISYVGEAEFTFAGTATTAVTTRIPSAVALGDLLICGSGNVSNLASGSTMNNSWTKLQEVGIDSTNCYFILAAKIATATEVSAAGNTVQIATQSATTGNTNKTSQCIAYRGTYDTVAAAVPSSNVKHETSPADQIIETNSVTPNDDNQWLTTFFNMASGGDQSAASFSSSGYTFRGDAKISNAASTTSCVSCYDSNGTVAVSSTQRSGTWSSTATRLNGAIAVIAGPNDKSGTDTGTGTEGQASIASNRTETGSGADSQTIGASTSGSDTGTRTETQSIVAAQPGTDTGSGTETQSIFESVALKSSSDTATGTEGTPRVAFTGTGDTASAAESVGIVSVSDWSDPGSGETGDVLFSSFLVMGPATMYVADFGALEPADLDVDTAPDSGVWTDLGGLLGGVSLTLSQEYDAHPVDQMVDNPTSRLKKREFTAEAALAEPSLHHFEYLLNGGTVADGVGYSSYTPSAIDSATPLTYRAVIIDGWAPGFNGDRRHKRRRVIMRKCLSTEDIIIGFYKDKQTTLPVTWTTHRVDGVIPPIKVIDEI